MNRSFRQVAVATTLAAGTVLAAAPAQAASYSARDAGGDVLKNDNRVFGDEYRAAPRHRNADARWVKVRHGAHRLHVNIGTADLRRVGRSLDARVHIKTPTSAYTANASLYRTRGEYRQGTELGQDYEVECRGLSSRFDVDRNVIRLVVPNRCLEDPRFVRVGVQLYNSVRRYTYTDDAQLDGRLRPSGEHAKYSPRVHRG